MPCDVVQPDVSIPEEEFAINRQRLGECENRYRELRHRIKNDLQKLASVLRLESQETGYPECATCIARVSSIAQLHTLLDAQIYTARNDQTLGAISVANYLQSVADAAHAAFGGHFAMGTSFDPDLRLEPERAALIGLILNEAIMNALKHAFPEDSNAKIAATFRRSGEEIFELSVSDNGIGFDTQSAEPGLGTRLLHGMAQQLHGTVTYPKVSAGTTLRLLFSVSAPHANCRAPTAGEPGRYEAGCY